jgi:hypothetical protein
MRSARAWAALLGLAALAARPAAAAPSASSAAGVLAGQPRPVVDQLFARKLVLLSRDEGPFVEALVIFAQPRPRTLRLLAQTARHTEFRPELERIETVSWGDREVLDDHHLKILFMPIQYRLRHRFDWEGARIWWELDPAFENDLSEVAGFWELYELEGDRTLARFGSRVVVGPSLPLWLQDAVTRKNLPATVERVRLWVDSNGTYRP